MDRLSHISVTGSKKQRLVALARLALIPLVLLLFSPPGLAAAVRYPDKLQLLQMLRDGKFKTLDGRISGYQRRYEAQRVRERESVVVFAVSAFRSSDPKLEARLHEWIQRMPRSYAARLARGEYYQHLGWLSRGESYASETHRERVSRMGDYFGKAELDFQEALSLNPRLSAAYASLIRIAAARGERRNTADLMRQGLKTDPYSFEVRERYLFSLQPKWGGSLEKMREFVDEMKPYLKKNPALNALRGYPDYTRADILRLSNKRRAAAEFYDLAVLSGDHWWFRSERANNRYWLNTYDKALEDANQALKLWPQHPAVLTLRAWIYRRQGRDDVALNDLNLALALDPLAPNILRARAWLWDKQKQLSEALPDIEKALKFGSHDAQVWWTKGSLQLYGLKKPEDAAQSLKRATELNPRSADLWYDYSAALNQLRDCGIVNALDRYLSLCEGGAPCDDTRRKWAGDVLVHAARGFTCPKVFLNWRHIRRMARHVL